MNDITFTQEQFENEAFKHYLRTGKMHYYDGYKHWVEREELKTIQSQIKEEYLNEELEDIMPQEDVKQENIIQKNESKRKGSSWGIPDWGDDEEESERDYQGNKDEEEPKEEVKSGDAKVSDLMAENSNFEIKEGKTYAVWSSGSCDGRQVLNGTVYEVGVFGVMSVGIPETHPNCKCELTMLDANTLPTKEKISLQKWEKDQTKPKPVAKMDLSKMTFLNEYTEERKCGKKSEDKQWSDMTNDEKEAKKIKQLEKFMKSKKLTHNINETKQLGMVNWINNVRPKGEWDYKQGGKHPEMEHVGNFNYGATGRALGIPASVLKGAGGVVQIGTGTSDLSFYDSYFDDPVDQEYIQQGIDWYDKNDSE